MATIYSITSDKGDKVYIGSTINLTQRKYNHKHETRNCSSKILIEEYGWENLIFTALEECSAEQRYERERHHIENTANVVNKLIPGQTKEERAQNKRIRERERYERYEKRDRTAYYEMNRDKHIEYMRVYNQKLREQYKAKKESASLLNGSSLDSSHAGISSV